MGAEIIARPDCEVVKKSASKPKENKGFSINYRFEKNTQILKPKIKYSGIKKESIPVEITSMIDTIQQMPLYEVSIPP